MPSPFASRVVKTIPIAFDPPNEVTIQKLAGRHFERAELEAQRKFMESIEQRGGHEAQKKMIDLYEDRKGKDEKPAPDKKTDPLVGLDAYTVCRFGIKGWTYPESLEVNAATGRVDALDDLGAEELKWFATEVLRVTAPSRFESPEEHKESEKNVSAA